MSILRLEEFPITQKMVIKSLYKQVKHLNDGQWREYKGAISLAGQRVYIECEFKLDNMFLTFNKQVVHDESGRLLISRGNDDDV